MNYWLEHQSLLYILIGCSVSNNSILIHKASKKSTLLDESDYKEIRTLSKDHPDQFDALCMEFDEVMTQASLKFLSRYYSIQFEEQAS